MRSTAGMLALAAALAAGCAPQFPAGTRAEPAPVAMRRAEPAPAVALEHETRYYRDEEGMLWDDRGRRHGKAPPQRDGRQ